ncbi:MAG: hypothetical protein COB02_09490 [Candidatus Cloacimonadota bacterium]|nr:MAG: hypothetical protein COB02_09490 [Candidatus Cloacimonadota bacterium]
MNFSKTSLLLFLLLSTFSFTHSTNKTRKSKKIYRKKHKENSLIAMRLAKLLVKRSISNNLSKTLFLKIQTGLNLSNRAIFDELIMESSTNNRTSLIRKYDKIEKQFTKDLSKSFQEKIDLHKVLLQINADVYKEFYTTSELKSLYRFYKSPLGVKFLKTSLKMLERTEQKNIEILYPLSLKVSQEAQQGLQSKVMELFQDDI